MEAIEVANEASQRQEEKNENEIEALVSHITTMLEALDPPLTSNCCIYRVPYKIRKLNESTYSPRVVSIGPFHNRDKRFESMEKLKLRYMKSLVEWSQTPLVDYIRTLKEWEDGVRSCYAESIHLSSDNFVKMILIDACFILELFLRSHYGDWSAEDPVLLKPWLTNDITQDLILLENQIPFFVLDGLFHKASSSHSSPGFPSFLELTLNYFSYHNQQQIPLTDFASINHFTDLMRTLYLPPKEKLPERQNSSVKHLHSASELLEAGLKFKASSEKCLLELQYEKGVLEMPCFEVYNRTETFIRNVMALEQCHYPYKTYVTDYIFLLDFLINTSKDVDVLVQKGIIVNWLGDSNAVATMVNDLCTNLTHSNMNSNYCSLFDNLNAFYNDRWHRRKASLRHDYFRTPWMTASSIAAVLLLLLTLIQTICSVVSLL